MSAQQPARFLVERLSPDLGYFFRAGEVLMEGDTGFQHIEIVDTPFLGRLMRLDGCFMTSERDEFFYHEPLVHVPAVAHAAPKRALVIGGGDGGSSEELLKHASMEQVVLAELDPGVIEASRRWLPKVHNGVFDDPRLDVRVMDGKAFVEQTAERFDLVVLDLTDPFGPSQALYTQEFYAACRRVLNPGGLLSLHAESPVTRPLTWARIVATLASVFGTVRPYMTYIPIYGTWWGMAVATDGADPAALSESEVDARIAARRVSQLQLYNGAMHRAMLALPNFVRELLARPAEVITLASGPLEEVIDLNRGPALVLEER